MARRKKKHEEHTDERWLLTYADVITLLFALFIVLFSISVVNKSKFDLLKEALSGAFSVGLLDNGPSVLPETKADEVAPITEMEPNIIDAITPTATLSLVNTQATVEQSLETQQLEEVKRRIEKAAAEAGFKGKVTATVNERGLAIRILTDGVLFDSGAYALRPAGTKVLAPIATALKTRRNITRIEGHTDSDPISRGVIRSNQYLGSFRSLAVFDYMVSTGVPEDRLISLTLGSRRPIAPNDTAANKQKNRRVEMLVLREAGAPRQTPKSVLGG